jgi:exopolysaccharide biosynthesis protein
MAGASSSAETPSAAATISPSAIDLTAITQTHAAAASETPPAVDSGWVILQEGLERRRITRQDTGMEPVEEITILRIDPEEFAFEVAYDPVGKELAAWQSETGTEVVVNGGYFRREQGEFVPDGLIISGGQAIGESYGDFAGMFAVGEAGPELRWLKRTPYDPAEPLRAALQCFPILIKPGGESGFPAERDDGIRARRTVIGQDRNGRILILVETQGFFTLRQLSVELHQGDLDLDIAMNLDGGPSSGMVIADPQKIIPAQYALPIVILIRAK